MRPLQSNPCSASGGNECVDCCSFRTSICQLVKIPHYLQPSRKLNHPAVDGTVCRPLRPPFPPKVRNRLQDFQCTPPVKSTSLSRNLLIAFPLPRVHNVNSVHIQPPHPQHPSKFTSKHASLHNQHVNANGIRCKFKPRSRKRLLLYSMPEKVQSEREP